MHLGIRLTHGAFYIERAGATTRILRTFSPGGSGRKRGGRGTCKG